MSGIFGKSSAEKRLANFQPAGFSSPGLSGSFDRGSNTFSLRRGAESEGLIRDIRSQFSGLSGEIKGLRPDVKPGFGRLTRSRIEAIRSAGSRAVGNLREELGKRRVLGSSFAQREIASQEAEFGRLEEQARAESFLQELDLTRQLISDQYRASIAGVATVLEQLNFESGIAADLSNSASQQLLSASGAATEAAAARRSGNAELATTIASAFLIPSDRRLKRNIERIGTINGFPWYSFNYIWGESSVGVMSDEVPRSFVMTINGYDYVNYAKVLDYGSI